MLKITDFKNHFHFFFIKSSRDLLVWWSDYFIPAGLMRICCVWFDNDGYWLLHLLHYYIINLQNINNLFFITTVKRISH